MTPDQIELIFPGWERWSNRQWAWEFLRQNAKFIKACVSIDLLETEELKEEKRYEIESEFYLVKFKDARTEYHSESSPFPRFESSSVKMYAARQGQERRKLRISIDTREIVFVFNMAHAAVSTISLEKQFQSAKNRFLKKVKAYRKLHEIAAENPRNRTPAIDLIRYLILLKMKNSGKALPDIASIIYPSKTKNGMGRTELRETIKNETAAANGYAKHDYLKLSALKTPISKSVSKISNAAQNEEIQPSPPASS